MKHCFQNRLLSVCLFIGLTVNSQTNNHQTEIAGAYYKLYLNHYTHVLLGINYQAKKPHWKNNLSFGLNITEEKKGGFLYMFTSLSYGKSYQLEKNRFFGSAGLNVGLYHAYSKFDNAMIRFYGIALIPKLEVGLCFKKLNLSTGIYLPAGFGYRSLYVNNEPYSSPDDNSHFKIVGAGNLYLKFILK